MKDHLYAVILAGGSGTRFWPMSREKHPKQFLKIIDDNTLLDLTITRIEALIDPERIYIVTNAKYKKETKKQVKKFKIPEANILFEPEGKNTAPAVCWAASAIQTKDPEAIMVVLPSDHLVLNELKFLNILKKAASLAEKEYLVTFGIVPTRAETGYGYLKTKTKTVGGQKVSFVEKFTEKPSLAKATAFVKSKSYYWNSGMFVWKVSVILSGFSKHLPKIYALIGDAPTNSHIQKSWSKLPSISIDHGILEKAKNVVAVEAKGLGWSDLGSWESLVETMNKDKDGNVFLTDVVNIDSKNSLVYGKKRLVVTIGLEDCIVVDTDDALLICKKDESQKVRDVVKTLKTKNSKLL